MSIIRSMMSRPVQQLVSFSIQNTEQIGIYTERVISHCKNVPFNTKRKVPLQLPYEASSAISTDILKSVDSIPAIARHVGGDNGSPDFELHDGRSLSIKSLYNSTRVAPQKIGQVSASRLKSHLNIEFDCFKAYFLANIEQMLQMYIKHLFTCEVLLIINYKAGKSYITYVSDTNNVSLKLQDYHIETSRTLSNWNESNTVYLANPNAQDKKLKKITIGEVQVHNHRSCCKFRFNIENLIAFDLVDGINTSTIYLEHKYKIKTLKLQTSNNQIETNTNIDTEVERLSNLKVE